MYQVYNVLNDTDLESLSLLLNISVDDLRKINKFIPNKLYKGDSIVIPSDDDLYINYVVKKGDNLYGIAEMFNKDLSTLYLINGIKENDYIYPEQRIIIPKENVDIYVSKEGDTLKSIGEYMGISINDLYDKNSNLYIVPEQLIIYKRV